MTESRTSLDVRSSIVETFRGDLVGPALQDLDLARERLNENPSRWYLTGFLAPADEPAPSGRSDEDDPWRQTTCSSPLPRQDQACRGRRREILFYRFFSAKTARSTVARGQWGAPRSSPPPAARPEVDRHGAAAASWKQLGHCHRGPSAAAVDCGSVRVSVRYLPAVSAHAVDDRVLRAIRGRHAGLCGPRE
jgi:hypothetical protein